MSGAPPPRADIGMAYLTGIYANAKIETVNPQPLFILHRDTIRTFLHEQMALLSAQGRALGWLGIFVTVALTLLTAEFHPWLGIGPGIIGGSFAVMLLVAGGYVCLDVLILWRSRHRLSVDSMVDALGGRGGVIKPSSASLSSTSEIERHEP